jgi:hypothetical protein
LSIHPGLTRRDVEELPTNVSQDVGDAIAHWRRFDTHPRSRFTSTTMIRNHALGPISALEQIKVPVGCTHTLERTDLVTQAGPVDADLRSMIQQAEDKRRRFMIVIRMATYFQLREVVQSLGAGYVRLIGTTEQTLSEADLRLNQSVEMNDRQTRPESREGNEGVHDLPGPARQGQCEAREVPPARDRGRQPARRHR